MTGTTTPSTQSRNYVLGMLTLVYAFNFIDRQILGILAPFIANDLGFDDSRIGLLTGFYFALFYTSLALPIAWLADRANRVTIICISLAVWSAFTILSGFAVSFAMLAFMRIGVAIGEAGGSPPSHSILSDLYPRNQRARALGIYSLGIPMGIMLAYFASAALAGTSDVNWRLILIVVGVPGVVIAALLRLTIQDPPRGQMDQVAEADKVPFWAAMRQLITVRAYWAMCLGIAFASFAGYAINSFIVAYVVRSFGGIPIPTLLITLGAINGTMYAAGVYAGGVLADRWAKKTVAGYALGPLIGVSVAGVMLVMALLTANYVFFLVCMTVFLFFAGFYLGPSFSVAQNLAPVSVRSTSSAVFFFVLNMIALGGGPTITGMLSDHFAQTHGVAVGLKYALMTLSVPLVLSAVGFALAARWLPADWRRAHGENG